jgi:hypothetical protein
MKEPNAGRFSLPLIASLQLHKVVKDQMNSEFQFGIENLGTNDISGSERSTGHLAS